MVQEHLFTLKPTKNTSLTTIRIVQIFKKKLTDLLASFLGKIFIAWDLLNQKNCLHLLQVPQRIYRNLEQ